MKGVLKRVVASLLCVTMLVSCGGGGGSTPTPPVSAALENPETVYSQQQVATAKISNYTLSSDTYQAKIDGTLPITVAKTSASSVAWFVPALVDGPHTLEIELGGEKLTIPFSTHTVTVTQSVDAILEQTLPQLISAVDSEIAEVSTTSGDGATIAWLQNLKANLSTLPAQVASLSANDQQILAAYLYQNFVVGGPEAAAKTVNLLSGDCTNSLTAWRLSGQIVAVDIATIVAGYLLAPATGGLSGLLSIYGLAQFVSDLRYVRQTTDLVLTNCLGNPIDSFSKTDAKAASKTVTAQSPTSMQFIDNQTGSYKINTEYSITDNSILSGLSGLVSKINSVPSLLIPADISSYFSNIKTNKTEISDAATYSIQSISNNNIRGSVSAAPDGSLQLNFSFATPPSTGKVPFTFTLVDSRDSHTTTVSATLAPSYDGIYRGTELLGDGYRHDTVCTVNGTTITGGQHFYLINNPGAGVYGTDISGTVNLATGAISGQAVIRNVTTVHTTFHGRIFYENGKAVLEWATAAPDHFGNIQTGYGTRQ